MDIATRTDRPIEVRTEHLCDIRVDVARTEIHATPLGTRANFVIGGGRVDGPQLSGTLLATGGDWTVVGADGVARMDVRATIDTDDGALVHLSCTGRVLLDDGDRARFLAGETIGWRECGGRASPLFETGDERYAWLNPLVTVATLDVSLTQVDYRVFAVR